MNVTPEQQAAWAKTLECLKNNMNAASYNVWFRPLELYSVREDTIIIIVESYMALKHINSRYYTDMYNAVNLSFGRAYELTFYTKEQIAVRAGDAENSTLNPKYTFDSFVVGPSNSFAHAASMAVAEAPSESYNPLFIYGSAGLGKTHLINAIGNFILMQDPLKNILLTSSEAFTNELIDAITHHRSTTELRTRFRSVDVLMVDDIQFLAKTKTSQEEFFHTFNDLYNAKKQIIITSDRPPRDIPTLEERLRSRFEWGLIVDIQKPDYETRVAILRKKAEEENIIVGSDVINLIARSVESNIRELEGALTRLNAQCQLMGTPITMEAATSALTQLVRSQEIRTITPQLIAQVISREYGVTSEDIFSKKRTREISDARQICMYLCRELLQLSTTNIGEEYGGRDHTTVMHACEKVESTIASNFSFSKRIEELKALIQNA